MPVVRDGALCCRSALCLSTGPGPAPNRPSPPAGEAELGKLRDYAVDMVPKFIMAGGQLVKVLIHTGVANYMEFKPVDGSFVYSSKAGKVCKVPATPEDAMKSSLMGMMEKTRMVQFTLWVSKVKLSDRATWKAGNITKTQLQVRGSPLLQPWLLLLSPWHLLHPRC